MSKLPETALCGLLLALVSPWAGADSRTCVDSPRKILSVCLGIDARGPYYDVSRGQRAVMSRARLGLVLDGFGNQPANRLSNVRRAAVNHRWEQPWGEQRFIDDHHHELKVSLSG